MTLVIGAGDAIRPDLPRLLWLLLWPAAAVIFLYIEGALVSWTGKLLGGRGDSLVVRAALAWPEVITIIITLIYIAARLMSPLDMLMASGDFTSILSRSAWLPSLIVWAPLFTWRFIVLVACIGEVHGFSFWRALGAWFIAMCAILMALFAINMTVALAPHF